MLHNPQDVAEPHKEIRFTRSGQGQLFGALAAVCIGIAVVVSLFAFRTDEALLPQWWVIPPLVLGLSFGRLAFRCVRHAYLILTPLGIEIFPFWKPQDNLHVLFWSEIAHAEVDEEARNLTLHHDHERSSGVVVSISPIHQNKHPHLARAIKGLMEKREQESTENVS